MSVNQSELGLGLGPFDGGIYEIGDLRESLRDFGHHRLALLSRDDLLALLTALADGGSISIKGEKWARAFLGQPVAVD